MRLKPFIIPVFRDGQVRSHVTIELVLEISDKHYFKLVRKLMPKLRDAIQGPLYYLMSSPPENPESSLPKLGKVKIALLKAGHKVVPKDILVAVLIHRVLERRFR